MEQQITPIEQFTYQVVVGGLASQSSGITYNFLKKQGLIAANTNSELEDGEVQNDASEEDKLRQGLQVYSSMFSELQYRSAFGQRELGLVQSGIERKFGGLEGLLELPDRELTENLIGIQTRAIKEAYSVAPDGQTQLSPEESALMYVTNGGNGLEESLNSIKSGLNPELSPEQRDSFIGTFSIVAQSDMYARALRAEQIFGVKMFGADGQLQIPNYAGQSSSSSDYRDAA